MDLELNFINWTYSSFGDRGQETVQLHKRAGWECNRDKGDWMNCRRDCFQRPKCRPLVIKGIHTSMLCSAISAACTIMKPSDAAVSRTTRVLDIVIAGQCNENLVPTCADLELVD